MNVTNPIAMIFEPISLLLIMILVGFLLGKGGVFQQGFNQSLTFFLLKVTLPALIFVSMLKDYDPELLLDVLLILLVSFACYGLYMLVAIVFTSSMRIPRSESGLFQFALIFSNVGFMGFPIVEALWGRDYIFHTAIFNMPFHLFLFTLGVVLMTRGKAQHKGFEWKLLLSPGILATVLGFFFFLFSWRPPELLVKGLDMLGSLTTPLSMILIGSLLSALPKRAWGGNLPIWALCSVRLLVLPLLVFFLLQFFPLPQEISRIAVIISAMPAAANTPLLAHEYGSHELLASQVVFLTTLLSFITLPIMLMVLNF